MQEFNTAVPSARTPGWGRITRRIAVLAMRAATLAGCGMVEVMIDGFKHCSAVADELAGTVGVKPGVGVNWTNGRLKNVSITFPKMVEDKPLREVAELTRAAVAREFKERADNIELAFSLGPNEATPTRTVSSAITN